MRPHRRVAPYDADVVSSRFLAPKKSYSTLPLYTSIYNYIYNVELSDEKSWGLGARR